MLYFFFNLTGYSRKLKRLNLGGNQLSQVPQKALSVLDNLRKLELQENKIKRITEGDFEGESAQSFLTMFYFDWWQYFFFKLPNDRRFIVCYHYKRFFFSNFSTFIFTLFFLSIIIRILDDLYINFFYFFLGLKSLDSLILAHNQLTEVPARVFSHLTLLNSLELEGNQITIIDPDAFSGLEGK